MRRHPRGRLVTELSGEGTLIIRQRHEGHDVDDAKSWVNALVVAEVQRRNDGLDQGADVGGEGRGGIDESDDGAVMTGVAVAITKRTSGRDLEGRDPFEIAAF